MHRRSIHHMLEKISEMAKKKREEIEAQIAELQKQLAEDDEAELWVQHPKTGAVGRLRGAERASFLASILGAPDDGKADKAGKGKAGKEAEPDDDEDQDDEDDEDEPDDDPPPRNSVFGRR